MALEHLELTVREWSALEAGGLVLPPHLMPQPQPPAVLPAPEAPAVAQQQQLPPPTPPHPQPLAQAAH